MSLETLDVGQANELKLAFRRNGWTNEEVKKLCEGNVLTEIRKVILGQAEVKLLDCDVIDLDADPFVPEGFTFVEHVVKGGQWQFNAKAIELYLSKEQKKGKAIGGNELRKRLKGKAVLNANVLDYLLAHKELIPDEWKDKWISFFGTIYRGSGDALYVRCLDWYGGRWHWGFFWLDNDWNSRNHVALRATFFISPPNFMEEFLYAQKRKPRA